MTKYMKISMIALALAAICWWTEIVINPSGFESILGIAAIIFSLLFVCFLVIAIMQKINKNISPYLVFAIVDGVIGISVLAYAIYDILTDTGWFAGLLGTILLIFVAPIFTVFLLIDFGAWLWKRKKGTEGKN